MAEGDIEPWLPWFRGFYDGFPLQLEAAYDRLPADVPLHDATRPQLWKYNGDEILLQTTLSDYRQVLTHIMALRLVIERWRESWPERLPREHAADHLRKRPFPLDLKGTAWLAGFPVINSTIWKAREVPLDFIGPQVDLGFRLARFASRTSLVVDASLAHILAAALPAKPGADSCRLRYLGRKRLKGILEDLPYPVFAVDVPSALADAEEALQSTSAETHVEARHVVTFCERFHSETVGVGRPFIKDDAGGRFGLDPERHAHLIQRWKLLQRREPEHGWLAEGTPTDAPSDVSPADVDERVHLPDEEEEPDGSAPTR